MIKYFTLLIWWFSVFCADAQQIIYSEGFDEYSSYTITGWTSSFSGAVPWQAGMPYQVGGCMLPAGGPMSTDWGTNQVACIADCGLIDYNNSNVFIATPAVDMTLVSGAWLRYDSYFEQYSNGAQTETADVEVSIDGGTTWTVIQHVPANPSLSNFYTWYIDLGAYSYQHDVRIGFRYSDAGGHMMGWAIDNVQVIVPGQRDLAIQSVTPSDSLLSYVATGTGYTHHATVFNAGLDTIHAFTLNYRQGSGPIETDHITGLTLAPFTSMTVAHNIPDVVTATGNFPVTMWVMADSDVYPSNDTLRTRLNGADFIPQKKLLVEEGEATWNGWSPRNMTYLNALADSGVSACMVAVHEYDSMEYPAYNDFITGLYDDYIPYILLDRKKHIPIDSFFSYVAIEKQYFGYADISVNATITDHVLSVSGEIDPAVDMSGDYRVTMIVTEDSVHSGDPSYAQVNNYAGGADGPMGGYELLPNPVPASSMYYNHVARLTTANPCGEYGFLPFYASSSTPYDYSLSAVLDPAWQPSNLKVIVALIDNSDSIVLNSNQAIIPVLSVLHMDKPKPTGLYPNPCTDMVHVYFEADGNAQTMITVTDMTGRQLYAYPETDFKPGRNEIQFTTGQLPDGIYLVTIGNGTYRNTLKLEVAH